MSESFNAMLISVCIVMLFTLGTGNSFPSPNPNQTKPMMNQYKATTRIPHISEPFVDWYEAETEEQARIMWKIDREDFGLPVDASVKFEYIGKIESEIVIASGKADA
jgi:hypothetical protein